MKVGDLVRMPGSGGLKREAIGIVAKMPFVGPNGEKQQTPRVGIYWMDGGDQVDWEPICWLEVINESR
jgi:hypothetical protein